MNLTHWISCTERLVVKKYKVMMSTFGLLERGLENDQFKGKKQLTAKSLGL